MRGCSSFTRVSTNYRRLLIVCPKMVQPYQTMMSSYATKKLRICLKSVEGHWANTEAMAHCHIMSSVAKFYTSEVRLSRRWNGNITASTWWVTADKSLYIWVRLEYTLRSLWKTFKQAWCSSLAYAIFLEGVKFTVCPIFIYCKIIVPLWIETRTAYKWVINVRTRLLLRNCYRSI